MVNSWCSIAEITTAVIDARDLQTRRFPALLSPVQVIKLENKDFIRYCRESLWDQEAAKMGMKWEDIPKTQQQDIDFRVLMRITNTLEEMRDDKEKTPWKP